MSAEDHEVKPPESRARTRGFLHKTTGIVILLAAVAAAGNMITRVTSSDGRGTRVSSGSSKHGSDAQNRRLAEDETKHLLSLLRLPRGVTEVKCPRGGPSLQPASDHLIFHARCWRIGMPFEAVAEWITNHPPRGLTGSLGGRSGDQGKTVSLLLGYTETSSTDAYREQGLQVSVNAENGDSTLVRADGVAIWISYNPVHIKRSGPQTRVTLDGGCPSTLGNAEDVRNERGELEDRLLPARDPIAATVCSYNVPSHLIRRVDLTPAQARSLAKAINRVFLGSAGNTIMHCPMDTGLTDILVFRYADRTDVDLSYHNSGCASLANGYVISSDVGNPDFEGNFIEQMTTLGLGWNHA